MPKKQTKKETNVSYRLHLTDSNNHAVFIDLNKLEDIEDSKVGVILVTEYLGLIEEHDKAQKNAIENDKVVADRVEATKNKIHVKTEATDTDVEQDFTDEELENLEA